MGDEDLRTMVREFRESMTAAVADIIERIDEAGRRIDENRVLIEENTQRIEEQGNELRHRISVAETAILNSIRDLSSTSDRRTTRVERRLDRVEDRLDLPEDPPSGAA